MTSANPGPTVDVVAVGNALVDVLVQVDDALVTELQLAKGAMGLVDEARQAEIYAAVPPGIEVSGGSAANTAVAVAALGGSAAFIGRIRDDQLGRVFAHDLRATGVEYDTAAASDGPGTGCCLILVTPDAERTLNTFLGASSLLAEADIDAGVVASGRVVYLEGYLFDRPAAQEAFRAAARLAHDAGREVAMTLSDAFCVDRHRDAFNDMIDHHVDILFANEAEALSLTGADGFDAAVDSLAGRARVVVVTRGEDGAVVVTPDGRVSAPAVPVDELVDTTGAGDAFAAGFLYGHCRDLPPETCLRLGAVAASEVISHMGPRPVADLAELAAPVLTG